MRNSSHPSLHCEFQTKPWLHEMRPYKEIKEVSLKEVCLALGGTSIRVFGWEGWSSRHMPGGLALPLAFSLRSISFPQDTHMAFLCEE